MSINEDVFRLYHRLGFTNSQIAENIGITEDHVNCYIRKLKLTANKELAGKAGLKIPIAV